MIYIDPDLHNPKINGIPLIVDNRINPSIAINKDDLIAADGISIEKFDDGTISISADVNTSQGESKYTTIQAIDFMSNLPSVLFKYLNALFDGIGTKLFYYVDHTLDKKREVIKPNALYEFDLNGTPGSIAEGETFGYITAVAELEDREYRLGQGVLFTIEKNQKYVYNITISSDQTFESIVANVSTGKNVYFVSFNDFESGTYYWRVRAVDKDTLMYSEYSSGYVEFTHQEPLYSTDCCPRGLTGPSEDFDITMTCNYSYAYDSNWNSYDVRANPWVFFSDNCGGLMSEFELSNPCISWSRKDGKKMLASSSVALHFWLYYDGANSFTFEGSDNGTDWDKIQDINCSDMWSSPQTAQLSNVVPYKYLRVRCIGYAPDPEYDPGWIMYLCDLKKIEVY